MASEIDLDAITPNANGKAPESQFASKFEPMRRKMDVLLG